MGSKQATERACTVPGCTLSTQRNQASKRTQGCPTPHSHGGAARQCSACGLSHSAACARERAGSCCWGSMRGRRQVSSAHTRREAAAAMHAMPQCPKPRTVVLLVGQLAGGRLHLGDFAIFGGGQQALGPWPRVTSDGQPCVVGGAPCTDRQQQGQRRWPRASATGQPRTPCGARRRLLLGQHARGSTHPCARSAAARACNSLR